MRPQRSGEGIDILHRQMEGEDNAYIQKFKKAAFVNGISIYMSVYSPEFLFLPTRNSLQKEIEHTKKMH
jgi:hypothetical protein